jgi:hypothetical protein
MQSRKNETGREERKDQHLCDSLYHMGVWIANEEHSLAGSWCFTTVDKEQPEPWEDGSGWHSCPCGWYSSHHSPGHQL